MADSNIDWTDKVWNPVTGCTPVSEGCKNCYAKKMSKRLEVMSIKYKNGFKVTCHPKYLDEPLGWKKPKRIFVCSMGDLFHEDVDLGFLFHVFDTIEQCPQHTFLILTKRPERIRPILYEHHDGGSRYFGDEDYHPNVYLGVSVEDQATADERIPLLLQTPAAKRFVSYEPALGPVDFERIQWPNKHKVDVLRGGAWDALGCPSGFINHSDMDTLDQIIMGGETGPGARPLHPDWVRSVRDQCKEAGVPFFFKQWGEWLPGDQILVDSDNFKLVKKRYGEKTYDKDKCGENHKRLKKAGFLTIISSEYRGYIWKVGKKNAGHLIDGKEHRELI